MRCAVYTRKSSEEGLEQDFNSLAAQREACEAYIVSQRSQGWRIVKTHYDDGGVSGGTLVRPALISLLGHIELGRIDVVVLYKIDRLTRSLTDFAKLIERFDDQEVSVVAVTQPFNTTTSMGRLTLNVLLSFAQFEREITGERIRDKIAASKQKGLWMGGVVPLGFNVEDRKLTINPEESNLVRHIFDRYQELGSVRLLKEELDREGFVSKQRLDRHGQMTGGRPFSRGSLYTLLRNPLYIGRIRQGDTTYDGLHNGIVKPDIFESVQGRLDQNRVENRTRGNSHSLLAGRLFDADGHPMSPSHTRRHQRKYRYYVSQQVLYGGKSTTLTRVPAHEIEHAVMESLLKFLQKPLRLIDRLPDRSTLIVTRLNETLEELQRQLRDDKSQSACLRSLVKRIDLSDQAITMTVLLAPLYAPAGVSNHPEREIQIGVPIRIVRCQHGKKLVFEGLQRRRDPDEKLVDALIHAHQWHDALDAPDVRSFQVLARKLNLEINYLSRIHKLIYLAPDIQLAILEGQQPPDLTLDRLSKPSAMPLCFEKQRNAYGFTSHEADQS